MTSSTSPQAPTATVRTVLGDVSPAELGRVNYHEHLFQVSGLLPGDDLDDEKRSGEELGVLRASGFEAMVDATPVGLGRRPAALARLSSLQRVRIVATTGRHRDAHYPPESWVHDATAEEWATIFVRELTVGQPDDDRWYADRAADGGITASGAFEDAALAAAPDGRPVRAGLLKAAIDYWRITTGERAVLEGVAAAHTTTGAAVMVHTESCSAALEVLDLLAALGVAPRRVVIAHADRVADPHLHAEIAATGASLGYDGPGRLRNGPDQVLIDSLAGVVERGYGDRVLLGADVARASRYLSYGGMPGLGYLGERFIPRLIDRLGPEAVRGMLVDNPARFLAWTD